MSVTQVPVSCARCGSQDFKLPEHPVSTSTVTCKGCGATGRYGTLMRSATRQVETQVKKELRPSRCGARLFQ
jgi:DNA-directed RNA polymerase subunit RPC12/RpoP